MKTAQQIIEMMSEFDRDQMIAALLDGEALLALGITDEDQRAVEDAYNIITDGIEDVQQTIDKMLSSPKIWEKEQVETVKEMCQMLGISADIGAIYDAYLGNKNPSSADNELRKIQKELMEM
jgi:methanogenic corrinoid protein MtbC1